MNAVTLPHVHFLLQINDNAQYVLMLEKALSTPYLYFSYTYDLTHTLQRLHNTTPEFLQVGGLAQLKKNLNAKCVAEQK